MNLVKSYINMSSDITKIKIGDHLFYNGNLSKVLEISVCDDSCLVKDQCSF